MVFEKPVGKDGDKRLDKAGRDIVALGIAAAAIIMFLGTGGRVLPQAARALTGSGVAPDALLVNAVLLNIALIIFGWRRYRDLTQEVAERQKAENAARILAETDELTGSLNRRSITPATEQLMASAIERGHGLAFLMIDLDNFKQINDVNGHMVGDEMLRTTAIRIKQELPEDSVIARLGGDEFACVLAYDSLNTGSVDKVAARIIDAVAQPIKCGHQELDVTVSVGIATAELANPVAGEAEPAFAKTLMHRADIAMYHAKKQGRNRFFWFETPMENEQRFRKELEVGIRRGMVEGEFVPFYEQQVDLDTGELVGFEMLARWLSPDMGIVGPDVFIPVAEEMGVIGDLSEELIGIALEDAKTWNPKLTLSINISPVQLRDPWFSQKILKLLTKHGFPPNRLEIEITESCLHENLNVVRTMITSLKNQGVAISLDDFGTGYSSLAQLRSLPFDRIKIDRSFVSEMDANRGNSKIVDAIVSLGEGLKLPITAEGIESDVVLDQLRKLGPLKGQGYFYGRPEDAKTVTTRLAGLGLLAAEQAEPAEDADQPMLPSSQAN
ncbi:EAL domain-containing protein [Altererythrobacter sp. ZODW24]|uniref:putative bifunctional diguanylate cyclase/phosphodiesterase n=1 Tax=Altererythrobacter sp. ZODW24 TaxID=2185142 RepID=UPI001F07EA6A|nr:EAL domain-containing protein [Altererythrobacter sp. ZODW24]